MQPPIRLCLGQSSVLGRVPIANLTGLTLPVTDIDDSKSPARVIPKVLDHSQTKHSFGLLEE